MDIGALAPFYRLLERAAFGHTLERSRFVLAPHLRAARRVLVFGEGDGRMLRRMLEEATSAHFDVIEICSEMIALAAARPGADEPRVTFWCADARTVALSGTYDAIVTCFFLDCFSESDARALVSRACRLLTPGGQWLVAEFTEPPLGWRQLHARLWLWTMYRFFALTTGLRVRRLPPVDQLMREQGLNAGDMTIARAGLVQSRVWIKPDVG